jgi:uncharacterized membrane protein
MKLSKTLLTSLLLASTVLVFCSPKKQAATAEDPTFGLQRPVLPAAPKERDFSCHGNEPNWSLTIQAGQAITYTPMGGDPLVFPYVTPLGEEGQSSWIYTTQDAAEQQLTVVVRTSECSDGMSDRKYPFTVSLILNRSNYLRGCGR